MPKYTHLLYRVWLTKSPFKTNGNSQLGVSMVCSVIDGTRSKTLLFEHHSTIENTLVKLKAIYNPLERFGRQFLPGYEIPRSHKTTSFTMNYREYHQRELYLLVSDIFWLTSTIKSKFVYDCIMYKRLHLLIHIVSKSSKILQQWAITYDLYMWHSHY